MALICDQCGKTMSPGERVKGPQDAALHAPDWCRTCADRPCIFCGELIVYDRFESYDDLDAGHRTHRACATRVLLRAAERGERVSSDLAAALGRGGT